MYQELSSFKGIAAIDGGRLEKLMQREMKRCVADCEDRPADTAAREVTMTMKITPQMLQDGALTDIDAVIGIKSKLPPYVSRNVNCQVRLGNRAIFNDLNEADADQKTLDMLGSTGDEET